MARSLIKHGFKGRYCKIENKGDILTQNSAPHHRIWWQNGLQFHAFEISVAGTDQTVHLHVTQAYVTVEV
jgi:hypothetical protein